MSNWLLHCLAGIVSSCVSVQVLKYIPVMARPLVLLREQHPVRWTGVYADIEVSTAVQCTLRSWQSSLPDTRFYSGFVAQNLLFIHMQEATLTLFNQYPLCTYLAGYKGLVHRIIQNTFTYLYSKVLNLVKPSFFGDLSPTYIILKPTYCT